MSDVHGVNLYARGACRCDLCKRCWREYYKARGRALSRLAQMHPRQFRQMWDEELAKEAV